MTQQQIIALIVAAIGVGGVLAVFVILFANFRKFSISEIQTGKRDIELIQEYFINNTPKAIARKKTIKIVRNVLFVLFLVLIFFTICFTLLSRFTNRMPVGTKTLMVVATDSMSEKHSDNTYLSNYDNQFGRYSIIVLEKIDPNELEKYDVIAFKTSTVTLIHRIVGVEKTNAGTRYVTCGDKYSYLTKTDHYKPTTSDVIGRYTGVEIPFFGAIVLFLQAPAGIFTMAALLACLLIFDYNNGQISKEQTQRTDFILTLLEFKKLSENPDLSVETVEKAYLDKLVDTFFSQKLVTKEIAREVLIKSHMLPPDDENVPADGENAPVNGENVPADGENVQEGHDKNTTDDK